MGRFKKNDEIPFLGAQDEARLVADTLVLLLSELAAIPAADESLTELLKALLSSRFMCSNVVESFPIITSSVIKLIIWRGDEEDEVDDTAACWEGDEDALCAIDLLSFLTNLSIPFFCSFEHPPSFLTSRFCDSLAIFTASSASSSSICLMTTVSSSASLCNFSNRIFAKLWSPSIYRSSRVWKVAGERTDS